MTSEIAPKSNVLLIGQGRYDLEAGALTAADGTPIHLRKQSADVLAALSSRAGEVVDREALVQAVWKDIATTDDSLIQCIGDIRRALGKDVIETYPKVGYRLVADVASVDPPTWRPRINLRLIAAAGALVLFASGLGLWFGSGSGSGSDGSGADSVAIVPPRIVPDKTLAVLPFVNLGGGEELQFFGDGLSEDLTTDLAKIPDLTVIAFASSGDFPQAEAGFREIADNLGVRYLVRGTVRHSNDRVRINVSLIDPFEGVNVWAERFDRVRQDPFDVQEDVTRAIVDALSLSLNANVVPSRVATDAYFMLLRGLEPLREGTVEGNRQAREYFEKALELEPNYARAHAYIAVAYGRDMMFDYAAVSPWQSVQRGLQAAIAAIRLDPDIPNAYFALAILNLAIGENDKALAAARHSIQLNRNFAEGYAILAEAAVYGGDLEEAREAIQHAKRLHPHHPARFNWIEAQVHLQLGNVENARVLLEVTVEEAPGFAAAFVLLAATYGELGEHERAKSVLAALRAQQPGFQVDQFVASEPFAFEDRRQRLDDLLQTATRH
ncbi:winged helix-turn-helix domain-containing protein [uncultured Roseobacter sp.]|uniref:winged helix-turn-helix domain-containing tetratricopeptide repeat protein n=1 Tax=uncultured Roseobacter sp. TaxID=114847 RepID=UPI00261632D2|nr:winged helix-turn-helix domain-containing protein [uncultured Roseobacter sp.]